MVSIINNPSRWFKNRFLSAIGLPQQLSSDAYVEYAREKGVTIGEGTEFFGEKKLDLGAGPMIEIGENCVITDRVRMVAHTSDHTILKERYGDENAPTFGSIGRVTVGDNVFIGENSMILPNVTIGDHCIIGSGSVVVDDIPSESVAAGNPCQVITDLQSYRDHCLKKEKEMMRTYLRQFEKQDAAPRRDGIEAYVRENTDFESVQDFVNGRQSSEQYS